MPNDKDEWDVLDRYFQDHSYPFTKHHLDSFRDFLKTHIPNVIQTFNPITMIKMTSDNKREVQVDVHVGGKDGARIYIDRPIVYDEEGKQVLLTPHEARLRNLTYQTNLIADLVVEITDSADVKQTVEFERVQLGSIPIMVHSDPCILHKQGMAVLKELGECVYDMGGYFIVDGKEKVIVSQERITTNRLFTSRLEGDQDFSYKGMVRCTGETGESSLIPRTVEFYMVKTPDTFMEPDVTTKYKTMRGQILVSLPLVNGLIPLTTVFRALGVESDRAILEHIFGSNLEAIPQPFLDALRPSFAHNISSKIPVYTQEEAIEYLRNRVQYNTKDHVKSILVTDLFPNITGSFHNKAIYLGYLIQEFIKTTLNILSTSDRDGYVFKRVDISGFLLAQLFQETYNKLRKNCRDQLDREYYYGPYKNTKDPADLVRNDNLSKLFPHLMMTETFVRSLKGMWGPIDKDPDQAKVQDLARISYIGFLSHLRRVNLPLDRSIKVTSPHRLHAQQWGIMCPFESPDGASIGYLKNFSMLTHVTFATNPHVIEECLMELDVTPLGYVFPGTLHSPDNVKVFINGNLFGITHNPTQLLRMVRLYRRNGLLNPFTSISWDIARNTIRIQSEAGRPCRPLFIVHQGTPAWNSEIMESKPSWFDMVFGTLLPKNLRNEDHYYSNVFMSPRSFPSMQNKSEQEIIDILEKHAGMIEYLDIEEENTCLIAMKNDDIGAYHTHLEIHPSTIFSVVTNNIPFPNHNFAPRNCFYGAQSKQAIGVYATNFTKRFDTMGYIQHYPQRPIITTRNSHYTGNDNMPNGFNAIVAVATYSGFNQEDGLIINRSAIDRGMFQITAYKSMSATEQVESDQESIIFGNPIKYRDQGLNIKDIQVGKFDLLDDQGIVVPESYIPKGQTAAVIGMIRVTKRMKEVKKGIFTEQEVETQYQDVSKMTDVHHYGKIDKVFVAKKGLGNDQRICKVRFRKVRRPELGDKACSRCAQKGVVGMILPAENMPFTKDGIIPDIIINPHAFPSRMTIAHIVECVFSKLCCMEGMLGDGTVFLPFDKEAMFNQLEGHKFEKYGNEIMYNGRTGEMIPTEIFLGPTFYLRLKHMVTDKVHSRGTDCPATGQSLPRVFLTRQPTSGRSKQGGLRLGEMERDVILAHGMSQFAKECMMEKADKYTWAICRKCGAMAKYAPGRHEECLNCASNDIGVITTPYTFKLMCQELESLGITLRMTEDPLGDWGEEDFDEEEEQVIEESQEGGNEKQPIPSLAQTSDLENEEEEQQVEEEESQKEEEMEETQSEKDAEEEAEEAQEAQSTQEMVATPSEEEDDFILKDVGDEEGEDPQSPVPSIITPPTVAGGSCQVEEEPETKIIVIDTSRPSRTIPNEGGNADEEDDEFFTAP